jgi:hypothetical protein
MQNCNSIMISSTSHLHLHRYICILNSYWLILRPIKCVKPQGIDLPLHIMVYFNSYIYLWLLTYLYYLIIYIYIYIYIYIM